MKTAVAALYSLSTADQVSAECSNGGNAGCSHPVGEKWDTWDMASSTYTYCFGGCAVEWLYEHSKKLDLPEYKGVVGVDHYWTQQGMPCVDGKPQHFKHQDDLAIRWKGQFPSMKMLQYRILSAVNYDMVIQDKITSDPYSVVRWRHQPGDASKHGNGSVCWNSKSACFNNYDKGINNPANKCSFHISAAAYNWTNPSLREWYVKDVIAPALVHGDGVWLDGIGPDNGAWQCSGACCGADAHNSPLVQQEIDAHCAGQTEVATKATQHLIANGGWEAMKCFDYKDGSNMPTADDTPTRCAEKLEGMAKFGADHSNYNFVVAYGKRTGGHLGYNDTTAAGAVAAFLLVRGQHWLFSIGPNGGSVPQYYPPYHQREFAGNLTESTARLVLTDYGRPRGNMTAVSGKPGVYKRVFEKATVMLDCNTFQAVFAQRDPVHVV